VIDQTIDQPCGDLDQLLIGSGLQGTFSTLATYTPPKNLGVGGQVQVTIEDQTNTIGLPSCNFLTGGVDSLGVTIGDGVYAGYAESGCLEKGNFTVFTE
jgi:hypothetical protein